MRDNLETYIGKVFKQAKKFLQKNFPEIYEDAGVKIGVRYRLEERLSYDYDMLYLPRKKCMVLQTYEEPKVPKDEDIITNAFGIKMQRKNSYLVSIIHELGEAIYLKNFKDSKLTYYDLDVSHSLAVSIELHALEKLIEQSSGKDRQDFIRRKKARTKDMKKYKSKGV